MERITDKHLQAQLERTAKAMGTTVNAWKREGDRNVATVGALTLDYAYAAS